jgi:CHAT domain-containing protein
MIDAGRAGDPEVTSAADPLILQLAAAGYGNEAVWLLRDALVPSPRQAWGELRGRTAYGRSEYLRWHRAVVDSLISSLLAFDVALRTHFLVEANDLITVIADTILWRRGFALHAERLGQRLARRDRRRRKRIAAFHDYRRHYGMWTMYLPSIEEQAELLSKVFAEEVWRRPEYDELWQDAYGDLTYDQYLEEFGEPCTADVLAGLPARACLVEYWWYIRSSGEAPQRREYLALRFRNDPEPELALADLGPAGEADHLVNELFADAAGRGDRGQLARDVAMPERQAIANLFKEKSARLREIVIDPLDVLSIETSQVIVVPDGPLTRVSFAAFPTSPDGYLLDSHVVSYMRSGADLVSTGHPSDITADPLVIGSPDFDLSQTGASTQRVWGALPGTQIEAQRIAEQLEVAPLTGADATVDRLLASRSPRVLHLATHGGMLPADIESAAIDPRYLDQDLAIVDSTAGYVFGDIGFLAGRRVPYQELRSVIVLAGANAWLASGELGPASGSGHVNAEDILDLDLAGTELVVLSACDTGRGILHLEEGVVGLRSSLRLAGAHSIVCALWPVPDLVTADLMVGFYHELSRHSHAEALRRSQLHIRRQYPDEPLMWAAFICDVSAPSRSSMSSSPA